MGEFTPGVPGEYRICLKLQLGRAKNEIYTGKGQKIAKVNFEIHVGDDLRFFKEKLEFEQLTDLQAKTEMLISNVKKIEKFQLLYRQNQEKFRTRSAETNSAVFWWGIIQFSFMIL